MKLFKDLHGRNIRLTTEREAHFYSVHPEMVGQADKIEEALSVPDIIVKSKVDQDADLFYKHYKRTPVTSKYLCVIVKILTNDLFVVTAYFTDTVKKGEVLWIKK